MRRIFGEIDRRSCPSRGDTLGSIAGGMLRTSSSSAISALDASNVQLAFGFLCAAISSRSAAMRAAHSDRFGRRPLILVGWSIAPLVPWRRSRRATHLWWGSARSCSSASSGTSASRERPDPRPPPAGARRARATPPSAWCRASASHRSSARRSAPARRELDALLRGRASPARAVPSRGTSSPRAAGTRRNLHRSEVPSARSSATASSCSSSFGGRSRRSSTSRTSPAADPLVDSHGLAPSTWASSSWSIRSWSTLFQLRITARTARVPASVKLSTAILLMGALPCLDAEEAPTGGGGASSSCS